MLWNISGLVRDISTDTFETKTTLMRPIIVVKFGAQAIAIGILAGILVIGALACPLWMGAHRSCDMPCSNQTKAPTHCPITICQASSSYLASDAGHNLPPLTALANAVVPIVLLPSRGNDAAIRRDDGGPPGFNRPLFLQNRSLLI